MNQRLIRMAGPAVAVAVIAALLGWMPARRSAANAEQRVDAAERLVDDIQTELEELDTENADPDELLAALATLTELVPEDHRIADVMLVLQDMADDTGMELLDVVPASVLGSIDDLRTPLGTSSVVVAVAMRGSYSSLIDFVGRLADQPRLLTLDAVAIGADETDERLIIDLEIRVFTTRELVFQDDGFSDEELLEEEVE